MLEHNQKFNSRNYNTWKQRMMTIFEYRCLEKIALGTKSHPTLASKDNDKFDEQNREAIMFIKLFVTNDEFP